MTTDELISKAIQAINTGQPRLAQLYMHNALEQTDKRRRELNPLGWQLRKMGEAFSTIGSALTGMFKAFELGFARAREMEAAQQKTDYALVGPGK